MHSDSVVIILASAGTGKTHQLSNRYIRLLLSGASPQSILASTFTRKAAGEIGERVLTRLAEAVLHEESREQMTKNLACAPLTNNEIEQVFTGFYASLSSANISTLDSICIGLARLFSSELGLPPDWKIFDPGEQDLLFDEACSAVFSGLDSDSMKDLSKFLSLKDAPRGVHSLIVRTLPPYLDLLVDVPDEAWAWLSRNSVPPSLDYHQLRDSLKTVPLPVTKKGAPRAQYTRALKIVLSALEEQDLRALARSTLVQRIGQGEENFSGVPIPQEFIEILRPCAPAIEYYLRQESINFLTALRTLLRHVRVDFEVLKDVHRRYSFSDIKRLLANFGITDFFETLYYRLNSRYEHVLLDEFQDTSIEEWNILRPLALEIASGVLDGRTFFCVGDKKQAIYQWRGGVAEIFDEVTAISPQFASSVHHLDTSYRSAPPVLSFVNRVFAAAQTFPENFNDFSIVRNWAAEFREHTSARPELSGFVTCNCGEGWQVDFISQLRTLLSEAPSASIGVLARQGNTLNELQVLLFSEGLGDYVAREGSSPLLSSLLSKLVYSRLWQLAYPSDSQNQYTLEMLDVSVSTAAPEAIDAERLKFFSLGAGGYVHDLLRQWQHIPYSDFHAEVVRDAAFQAEALGLKTPSEVAKFFRSASAKVEALAKPIRLMTIHGAKGLEFDAVFLPELSYALRRHSRRGRELLLKRKSKAAPIEGVALSMSKEDATFLPEVAELQREEQMESCREGLATLYVALTRAKHALYLYLPSTQATPSPRRTSSTRTSAQAADLVFHALSSASDIPDTNAKVGSVAYQAGDPLWFQSVAAANASTETAAITPSELLLLPDSKFRSRFTSEESTPLSLTSARNDAKKLSRGSTLHAILETIDWIDQSPRELPAMRNLCKEDQILIESFLRHPDINQYLNREHATRYQLYRELTLVHREAGEYMAYRVDRLHLASEHAIVIDYKFSLEGIAPAMMEKYRNQVEAYRERVCMNFGLREQQVNCVLLGIENPCVLTW